MRNIADALPGVLRIRYLLHATNNIKNKTKPSNIASYICDGCLEISSSVGYMTDQGRSDGLPINS